MLLRLKGTRPRYAIISVISELLLTPSQYGLIYHSTFIGRAGPKFKGRISRFLANKCSIASRIDCYSDKPTAAFGEALKAQVEERLNFFETGQPPSKNADAIQKVLEQLALEDDDEDEEEVALPKIEPSPKKDKKKKRKAEDSDDEEEEAPRKKAKLSKEEKKALKKEEKKRRKEVETPGESGEPVKEKKDKKEKKEKKEKKKSAA